MVHKLIHAFTGWSSSIGHSTNRESDEGLESRASFRAFVGQSSLAAAPWLQTQAHAHPGTQIWIGRIPWDPQPLAVLPAPCGRFAAAARSSWRLFPPIGGASGWLGFHDSVSAGYMSWFFIRGSDDVAVFSRDRLSGRE